MTATTPVEILMEEHQNILRVLTVLETRLSGLGQDPFPKEFFEQALDFFANYADGCHHYKEEDALFPAIARRGVPVEGGPIGCMLSEHDFGRNCLRVVRECLPAAAAGDREATGRVREAASSYAQMLRAHIHKEDNILFQMALRVLTPEDLSALQADFHNEENPRIKREVREKYEALAQALSAR